MLNNNDIFLFTTLASFSIPSSFSQPPHIAMHVQHFSLNPEFPEKEAIKKYEWDDRDRDRAKPKKILF
jgi:hypothetical protein